MCWGCTTWAVALANTHPPPLPVAATLDDVAVDNVRKLGNALSLHTGQVLGEATAQTFRRVAMLLQRGNSQMLGDRFVSYPSPEIDGIY